jgi:MSHA biogenesis protein MshJ
MALNIRERWMVACALFVVIFAVINSLLLSPLLARQKTLQTELETDQSQIQALSLQINTFINHPVIDPDAENKQRITELKTQLQGLETELNGLQNTLIPPDKMPELLRSLLKKNGKLKLIELKTLPTKGLLEDTSVDSPVSNDASTKKITKNPIQKEPPVYKHGVEITVEGRYFDLLDYVAELEKMPWHVLWSKAALNAEVTPASTWPENRLKLTVYTLSLDKTWLSI